MGRSLLLCLLAAAGLRGQPASFSPAEADTALKRYCVGCHNARNKTAGVALDTVRGEAVSADVKTWEKVLRKMRTGEMPPLGLPRPAAPANTAMTSWLEGQLDRAAAANPNPGSPSIHRLNRAEYSNAVRDLLALDLDHGATLPADDSGYGFDNIGEALTVSPLHMEKYMSTARRVARLAVGSWSSKPALERLNRGKEMAADVDGDLPLNIRAGVVVKRHFPVDAEYSLLFRVRGNPSPNMPPPRMDVRIDGRRVKLFEIEINPAEEAQYTRNFEIRLPVPAGIHQIGAGFLNEYTKIEGGPVPARRGFGPPPPQPVSLDYILVGGPFDPNGPGATDTRKRVFLCRPAKGQAETPCATRIITSLARRAYRRPVTAADTAPLLALFAEGRKDGGSFDAGIETALRAILMSPSFLFRIERDPAQAAPGAVHPVSELELASRLSFFLWSSIPDDELIRLATAGKLRASLDSQVKRMLADPKSRALVDNFAGQWLRLRNVAGWRPDPEKFPGFDDSLREALERETELFFETIVREDRNVVELINADYSFLNERLARHYGVEGVKGDYYRRVTLNGEERGGILTHGSILTVTSYPTRTSPVLRGKWILENVLGAPPPPPPPDVPDLEASAAISAKDLRKALEQHRANAACASCHSRLDPLGFALEKYDAVGKFRAKEGGAEIDASGQMPGGVTFSGAGGLKKELLSRQDDFVECLAEKLLIYGLGRGLDAPDLPAVRQVRRNTVAGEYKFSALVTSVVKSVPFQMRRTPER